MPGCSPNMHGALGSVLSTTTQKRFETCNITTAQISRAIVQKQLYTYIQICWGEGSDEGEL